MTGGDRYVVERLRVLCIYWQGGLHKGTTGSILAHTGCRFALSAIGSVPCNLWPLDAQQLANFMSTVWLSQHQSAIFENFWSQSKCAHQYYYHQIIFEHYLAHTFSEPEHLSQILHYTGLYFTTYQCSCQCWYSLP